MQYQYYLSALFCVLISITAVFYSKLFSRLSEVSPISSKRLFSSSSTFNSNFFTKFFQSETSVSKSSQYNKMTTEFQFSESERLPIYFFSHGGPTFMYEDDDFGDKGAWNKVKSIGKHIKEDIKPDFILVVSAHWQSNKDELIEISIPDTSKSLTKNPDNMIDPTDNSLIYDFYGFPSHMYKEQFHSKSSIELSKDIKDSLVESGFQAKVTKRGIDHGVWVPLKVAFSTNKLPEEEWDVDVPLIQISLTNSDDFETHFKLGEALSKYRNRNGLIICSGMSVHNLRDLGMSFSYPGKLLPYVKPFNSLLTDTVTANYSSDRERLAKLLALKSDPNHRKLLYQSHPTLEHFMPIVVASGAIKQDENVEKMYDGASFSLGWNIYRFGKDKKN